VSTDTGEESRRHRTRWRASRSALSAVLFGVGHLLALASSIGLSPILVVRTVLLNTVVGVGLGWLFRRRSLEAAVVAHASFTRRPGDDLGLAPRPDVVSSVSTVVTVSPITYDI